MKRRGLRRALFRRRFYAQLPRIVLARLRERPRRDAVFVSMMGGIGDLVNLFPTLAELSASVAVDVGTGPDPSVTLVRADPHVRAVYAPFVYKPIRAAHRRIIERTLAPFYRRVVLLDEPDSAWRTRARHLSAVYAEKCGCRPPARGTLYLTPGHRRAADQYLERLGLRNFIYVTQLVRPHRPERSWPLAHYHRLLHLLRDRFGDPLLVSTVGSGETTLPAFCARLERLDILTVAAVIERARCYVGPDTGPTHIAAALGVPTVSIHVGHPPEICRALGDTVRLVRQTQPLADPAAVTPEQVLAAVEDQLSVRA